jgi:hypothetical protein
LARPMGEGGKDWGEDRQSKGANWRKGGDHSLAKRWGNRTMEVDKKIHYVG